MGMFRKPAEKRMGVKVLLLGEKGVGKSVFSLSFPKVFAIDAEAGMVFYEEHPQFGKNLLGVANTQDFNDLSEAITEIEQSVKADPDSVGTFVVDSETKIYENLTDASLQVEEKKAKANGRDVNDSAVSMRGWGRIKAIATRLDNAKIDLSSKGVNVISISQIADVKEKKGDNFVKVGEKPVMQKGAEYSYDIVLKLFVQQNPKNGEFTYKSMTLKDRTGVTKVGQVVENPSYDVWKEFLESRSGAELLNSNLSGDSSKAKKSLEEEDAKAERSVVDKFKDALSLGEEQKKKALEMVKEYKIKNPLKPENAKELKALGDIVETVEAM